MTEKSTGDITLAGGAGEYMESATVVGWSFAVGDRVKAGDVLVVVETAKAATDVEAERDGVLVEIRAPVGTEVGIGAVLGRIADALPEGGVPVAEVAPETPAAAPLPGLTVEPAPAASARRPVISPLARKLARQAGLDVSGLVGTGPGGRIKSRDIARALEARAAAPAVAVPVSAGGAEGRTPLVLLHGFGANAGAWNPVRAYLDPSIPVLTPELPGHGKAPALAVPTFDGLVEAVLAQLEAAGVADCHLVGHSLGGAVAAVVAASPAVRVRSLTLIAPAGLGPEIDGTFLSGFLGAGSLAALTPWLERLVGPASALPRGYAQAVLRERERLGVAAAQAALAQALFPHGTQALRIADVVAATAVPLKVIWGRADRIIPAAHGAALPGHVASHGLDGIGHMPYAEAPELVARLVLQNLRAAGGPA